MGTLEEELRSIKMGYFNVFLLLSLAYLCSGFGTNFILPRDELSAEQNTTNSVLVIVSCDGSCDVGDLVIQACSNQCTFSVSLQVVAGELTNPNCGPGNSFVGASPGAGPFIAPATINYFVNPPLEDVPPPFVPALVEE